jgi:NAD(P)H-dependent FMN reductase
MKLVIFLGTARRERQGNNIGNWIKTECKKRRYIVTYIDPLKHKDLQVLTDQFKTKKNPSKDFKKIRNAVKSADAYIAITPEYNHGYSGALKNALDCFLDEYFFKCFGIVTYSGGPFGGVRAEVPLRGVCSELGASAIPTSLPISFVSKTFDSNGNLINKAYEKRLDKFLNELEWYARALKDRRNKGKLPS